jgi:hypothetical protein
MQAAAAAAQLAALQQTLPTPSGGRGGVRIDSFGQFKRGAKRDAPDSHGADDEAAAAPGAASAKRGGRSSAGGGAATSSDEAERQLRDFIKVCHVGCAHQPHLLLLLLPAPFPCLQPRRGHVPPPCPHFPPSLLSCTARAVASLPRLLFAVPTCCTHMLLDIQARLKPLFQSKALDGEGCKWVLSKVTDKVLAAAADAAHEGSYVSGKRAAKVGALVDSYAKRRRTERGAGGGA